MRIEKVIVKNFRSFDKEGIELVLPDIKAPISIVGHNNSGKSNLLNSILFGLHQKPTGPDTFDQNDFHNCVSDEAFHIQVFISPPIKCANAYAKFDEITNFHLKATGKDGNISSQHNCHGADGKQVRSPQTLPLKGKALPDEEAEILNQMNRSSGQTAYKNKDKVPLYYIDTLAIHSQLKANRYTLLGKMLSEIRKEFESKKTVLPSTSDIFEQHRGLPNAEVLKRILKYIEQKIIPTPKLEQLTDQIRDALKEELEIQDDDFQLGFGIPSFEEFYKDLQFYVKENRNKPKLPISRFGNGFISLFVISMLKALIGTDSGGKIIIIEEPETFLHEHYQEYFYQLLEKLAENNQVIYTTHSKKFVNIFKPDSIIKIETPEFGCSKVIHHPNEAIEIPASIDGYAVKNVDDFALYMRTLEPNIGNVIFAKKVIIVEGPHDVLAYKTVLSSEHKLEFHNVSIVAAWGKDTLRSLIQICKLFNIEYFVIHDFDIVSECDNSIPKDDPTSVYSSLSATEKAQYTKNFNILIQAGENNIHHNKPNIEGVLGIALTDKSSAAVYEKVSGKNVKQIMKQYPNFLSQSLVDFVSS